MIDAPSLHSGAGFGEVLERIDRYGDDPLSAMVLVGSTLPASMASASNPDGVAPELIAGSRRLQGHLAGWIDENAASFAPGVSLRTLNWLAEMVMTCSRRIGVDDHREILTRDFRQALRNLRAPTTVIHGDCDASAPIDLCGRKAAAMVPGSRLIVYQGGAHGLMLTDIDRLAGDIAQAARADRGKGGPYRPRGIRPENAGGQEPSAVSPTVLTLAVVSF